MNLKLISTYEIGVLNAGPKAKVDVEEILKNGFNCEIKTFKTRELKKMGKLQKYMMKVKKALFVLKNCINTNNIVIIQFPFSVNNKILHMIKNKIVFIHDIDGLRNNDEERLKKELAFIKTCKYIIAHNEIMKKFLISRGIPKEKIYILDVFDYLCDYNAYDKKKCLNDSGKLSIIYAGNLSREKSPFIYQIDVEKIKFNLNLYGVGIEEDINKNIIYKGSYLPEELPTVMEGQLGLIWDGDIDERDENISYKNYTKYNNPHKLSCYIAAELPVIAWKKAAIAEFIEKYNIGYTISNIYEINDINLEDYQNKLSNIQKLGKMVREGYFTKKVINEVLKDIKKTNN